MAPSSSALATTPSKSWILLTLRLNRLSKVIPRTYRPDDKKLFSSSHSRQIGVWDLSTLKYINSWKGHEGPVRSIVCHASGGYLATAGADAKVRIWDADHGFCTHHFKGHKGVVTSIMFHPNSERKLLFSGSEDATIRIWDLITKKCVATLEKHFSAVISIAFSEDEWTLFTAGRDKNRQACKKHIFAGLHLIRNVGDRAKN